MRRFAKNESGAIAIIAAVALPAVIAALGIAIDYSMGHRIRTEMQAAADAAAISVVRSATGSNVKNLADGVFESNSRHGQVSKAKLSKAANGFQANVSATFKMPTTFMRIFGYRSVTIDVDSAAVTPLMVRSVRFLPDSAKGHWEKHIALKVIRPDGTVEEVATMHYDVTTAEPPESLSFTATPSGWVELGDYTHAYLEFTIGPKMWRFDDYCEMGCYKVLRSDDPETSDRFRIDGVPVAKGMKLDIFDFTNCDSSSKHSWEDGGGTTPDVHYTVEVTCGRGDSGAVRISQ